MAVEGQLVARTVGELRATLPQDGELLASLGGWWRRPGQWSGWMAPA
jgi:hypothetical protein